MKSLIFASNLTKKILIAFVVIVFALANSLITFAQGGKKMVTTTKLEIKSSVFETGGMISKKYTCDGEDVSPPLSWDGIPEGTKSLALISDDPDAPMGTWVHWVMYNIPPSVKELKEGFPTDKKLHDGTLQGITDFKKIGYGGPCPPSGIHRYYFKLYALDTKLNLEPGATKKQLLSAMEGHLLAQAEVMGKYKRG